MRRLVGLLALTVVAPSTALAGDLVVESHVGARPGEAAELLEPVITALGNHRFNSPETSAAVVRSKVSEPSVLLSEKEIEGATKFVESAFTQFQNGVFKAALTDAGPGLETLAKGPATMIRLPDVRKVKLRGLIAAALAYSRLGRASEAQAMASEILRSFSDKPIDTTVYSPEIVELVEASKAKLIAKGTATLTVETDKPGTVIFINEMQAGVDRVTRKDLVPGEYRIVMQSGDKLGRVRRVKLTGGETRILPLSFALDETLNTHDGRVVLSFASEADRSAREGEFALALAREVGAKRVAVLGIRRVEGQQRVIGTLYAATRKTPDGAWLAAEPTLPRREALAALGNYLGGDKSGADLIEPLSPGAISRSADPARGGADDRSPSNALGWATLGLGVAAIGAGTALVLIHRDEFETVNGMQQRNENPRNTRTAGFITAGAGVAITGIGVYLLLRGGGKSDPAAVSIAPTRGGLAVGFGGSF